MTRPARALIDLQALRDNLAVVRRAAPTSRVMAIVKANGYGHGLQRTAAALAAADGFGVAHITEALRLHEAGVRRPITLLEGYADAEELLAVSEHGFEAVVHHAHQIELLECAQLPRPIAVWLKVDTGMHRLGFAPEAVPEARARLAACANLSGALRFMTHCANADDRDDDATDRQLQLFESTLREQPGERSIANSAALLGWPRSHAEWVRPGIMLYGVSPFLRGRAQTDGLRPVMTVTTQLIAINRFRCGDAIGYGGSWTCPEDMPIGVAAIGYGDGYPRHAPPGTPVLLNGRRVPLVGRVSMDMICLDLRGQPQARIGDPVIAWGRGLPVEEIAEYAGTIAYELLCGVAQRVDFAEDDSGSHVPT